MVLIICSNPKCKKHMWNPKNYHWGKNKRPVCPECLKKENKCT